MIGIAVKGEKLTCRNSGEKKDFWPNVIEDSGFKFVEAPRSKEWVGRWHVAEKESAMKQKRNENSAAAGRTKPGRSVDSRKIKGEGECVAMLQSIIIRCQQVTISRGKVDDQSRAPWWYLSHWMVSIRVGQWGPPQT